MIKTNINLNLIEEYKPSNRIDGADVKKLDWNECNLPYDEEYYKLLTLSLSSINYSEYPNINNENLLNLHLAPKVFRINKACLCNLWFFLRCLQFDGI